VLLIRVSAIDLVFTPKKKPDECAQFLRYFGPLLDALRELGGSGTEEEVGGAMAGRADKEIIITTGTFTAEARRESSRDGVPPIELIDGDKLIDMLESLELGLLPVKSFKVDDLFFNKFRR